MDVDATQLDVHATKLVVHAPATSAESALARANDHVAGGDTYSAAVEAILAHFRSQAEQMLQDQLQQHQHQALQHEDVLAVFQAYGEAQLAIQQSTERRLQSTIEESHA